MAGTRVKDVMQEDCRVLAMGGKILMNGDGRNDRVNASLFHLNHCMKAIKGVLLTWSVVYGCATDVGID